MHYHRRHHRNRDADKSRAQYGLRDFKRRAEQEHLSDGTPRHGYVDDIGDGCSGRGGLRHCAGCRRSRFNKNRRASDSGALVLPYLRVPFEYHAAGRDQLLRRSRHRRFGSA